MKRRELLSALTTSLAALPFITSRAAFAQAPADPYLMHVHPELRAMAAQMLPLTANQTPPSKHNMAEQRAVVENYAGKPTPGFPYEKRVIPGPKGAPPVTIYIVNAGMPGARPAILHTHGGGYTAGTAFSALSGVQTLSRELDCVVVTVEYRLAPETTYLGSVEDNYTALKWLHRNAKALGVDPSRIAVMGESAGGGHAALLAIIARDRGEVPVAFQCLIYPMLDDRTGTTRKVPEHIGRLLWTPMSNRFGWESFLGRTPGLDTDPAGGVPARVGNLAGLPPTFIGVGALDLFVDEDVDYAQRLNAAGVPTELILVPGAFHGFDGFPSKLADRFKAAKLAALRAGLGIS